MDNSIKNNTNGEREKWEEAPYSICGNKIPRRKLYRVHCTDPDGANLCFFYLAVI